ncbi:MAG: F0F1 ATP synthase subunit A [bacterium]
MDEHAGGHDADHGGGHEAEHHHGPKVPELPNLLGVVHNYAYLVETKPEYASLKNPFTGTVMQVDHFAKGLGLDDSNGDHFTAFETIIFGFVVVIALCAFFIGASRQLKVRAEKGQKLNGKAMFTEIVYTFLEDFFAGIVGRDSVRKHLPLIGTLFIYILCCNTFGLLWLGKAPTANLSFNLAMAAIVFLYVHGTAIMKSPAGWLAHFPGSLPSPKEMGGLAYVLAPILAVLFTVIHIMELFIQPASLALRLYGNVLGKDVLLGVFGGLIPYFPTHAPFLFLGLLLGAIQALIFSLLSSVYILMWEPHEHHHDDHHEHAGAHA